MKKSLGASVLVGPTPVWLIGSYDAKDRPNLMTAAWVGVCCSRPPCVSAALRPATYSHGAILERRAFTASLGTAALARQVDYMGVASGRDTDKFAAAGLTPVKAEHVDAPYPGEFPLILECRLIQSLDLGMHTLFVGEIMDVKAEESMLDAAGSPDLEKLKPMFYSTGNKDYFTIGERIGKAFDLGRS